MQLDQRRRSSPPITYYGSIPPLATRIHSGSHNTLPTSKPSKNHYEKQYIMYVVYFYVHINTSRCILMLYRATKYHTSVAPPWRTVLQAV